MRIQKEPCFVIHARPYSETSLLVEVFSRNCGRLTVIAKGARRQKSKFRGVLLPFRRLTAAWSGKGEVSLLTAAESAESWTEMRGRGLLCGFYINELVLKLLHRHDSHPGLFEYYSDTVARLRRSDGFEGILRLFEKRLLRELGYAMNLDFDADGRLAIDPRQRYRYIPHLGAVSEHNARQGGVLVSGATLCALRDESFKDNRELKECKRLMRSVISHQMEHRPLHSRRLFKQ